MTVSTVSMRPGTTVLSWKQHRKVLERRPRSELQGQLVPQTHEVKFTPALWTLVQRKKDTQRPPSHHGPGSVLTMTR